MNIEKSLTHIARKIINNKWATDYDKKCLKEVVEYIEQAEKVTTEKQVLFGKLYIYLYAQFIKYYEEMSFDGIPQKELHIILDRSSDSLIQELTDAINEVEMYQHYKHNNEEKPRDWEFDEVKENIKKQMTKAILKYTK